MGFLIYFSVALKANLFDLNTAEWLSVGVGVERYGSEEISRSVAFPSTLFRLIQAVTVDNPSEGLDKLE